MTDSANLKTLHNDSGDSTAKARSPRDPYADKCAELADQELLRTLPQQRPGVDFSHNDYLGLSRHPSVVAASIHATKRWGTGSTASRLLAGNLPIFSELETQIAADKKQESALIFASGFQANASAISALLDSTVLRDQPRVFSDRLNHASIHQGCFAAGVRQHRYRHTDLEHLESLLADHADCPRPRFILTETVFGMDGDTVDVSRISQIAKQYNAFLYLDEAHATGVTGPRGFGLSSTFNDSESNDRRVDLVMGTFSKAIGSAGAYVACSEQLKQYLINRCSGFIYSTAPSPAAIGAAAEAWNLIPELDAERKKLTRLSDQLRACAKRIGIDTGQSTTNIVPFILGDTARTMAAKAFLAANGITVSAIRPPTVPKGTARLRIAVSSEHTEEQVHQLVSLLEKHLGQSS